MKVVEDNLQLPFAEFIGKHSLEINHVVCEIFEV